MIDPGAFEAYRNSPNGKTTLPRLIAGVAVIVVFWVLSTLAVILAGMSVSTWLQAGAGQAPDMAGFLATPVGVLTALGSFAGIWIGAWVAMRFIHGEALSALFGNSRRLSWNGFAKGFCAVILTSLVSEILLYAMQPEIARGTIDITSWLIALGPVAQERDLRGLARVGAHRLGAHAVCAREVWPRGVRGRREKLVLDAARQHILPDSPVGCLQSGA